MYCYVCATPLLIVHPKACKDQWIHPLEVPVNFIFLVLIFCRYPSSQQYNITKTNNVYIMRGFYDCCVPIYRLVIINLDSQESFQSTKELFLQHRRFYDYCMAFQRWTYHFLLKLQQIFMLDFTLSPCSHIGTLTALSHFFLIFSLMSLSNKKLNYLMNAS